jgi:hypothetical protein
MHLHIPAVLVSIAAASLAAQQRAEKTIPDKVRLHSRAAWWVS